MNISVSEKRILKLVHPKFIETHSRPVKAAVIMGKYPKYSITRPDVFQFPWIVIKPEAILALGKVFYLVPHRTMHKLLKAAKEPHHDQPFPEQYESPNRSRQSGALLDREPEYGLDQPRVATHTPDGYTDKTSAGSTPKHFWPRKNLQSHNHLESDGYSPDKSLPESSPNRSINGNNIREVPIPSKLKSCLPQQNNYRKFLGLKVTFGSPVIIPPSPRQSPSPEEGPDSCPNEKHDRFANQSYPPLHTLSEMLKSAREGHQDQILSEQYPSTSRKGLSSTLKHILQMDYTTKPASPTVSSAGNTPKHFGHDKNHTRRMTHSPENILQHSRIGSHSQVNQKKGNNHSELSQRSPDDRLPESRSSSSRNSESNEEVAGVSRNDGQQTRSCLRKSNSYRKFLNLEVTFGSPVYIPTSPRKSPGDKGSPGAYHFYNEFYH